MGFHSYKEVEDTYRRMAESLLPRYGIDNDSLTMREDGRIVETVRQLYHECTAYIQCGLYGPALKAAVLALEYAKEALKRTKDTALMGDSMCVEETAFLLKCTGYELEYITKGRENKKSLKCIMETASGSEGMIRDKRSLFCYYVKAGMHERACALLEQERDSIRYADIFKELIMTSGSEEHVKACYRDFREKEYSIMKNEGIVPWDIEINTVNYLYACRMGNKKVKEQSVFGLWQETWNMAGQGGKTAVTCDREMQDKIYGDFLEEAKAFPKEVRGRLIRKIPIKTENAIPLDLRLGGRKGSEERRKKMQDVERLKRGELVYLDKTHYSRSRAEKAERKERFHQEFIRDNREYIVPGNPRAFKRNALALARMFSHGIRNPILYENYRDAFIEALEGNAWLDMAVKNNNRAADYGTGKKVSELYAEFEKMTILYTYRYFITGHEDREVLKGIQKAITRNIEGGNENFNILFKWFAMGGDFDTAEKMLKSCRHFKERRIKYCNENIVYDYCAFYYYILKTLQHPEDKRLREKVLKCFEYFFREIEKNNFRIIWYMPVDGNRFDDFYRIWHKYFSPRPFEEVTYIELVQCPGYGVPGHENRGLLEKDGYKELPWTKERMDKIYREGLAGAKEYMKDATYEWETGWVKEVFESYGI